MASENFSIPHTSGKTVYAVLWQNATYYDWTDTAFETPSAGSDANAVIACSEHALDGNGTSVYRTTSAVNLATPWNFFAPAEFDLAFYEQAGGSEDLTNDAVLNITPIRIQCGYLNPTMRLEISCGYEKDVGSTPATFIGSVFADENLVDCNALADVTKPTATFSPRQQNTTAAAFTTSAVSPDTTNGEFDARQLTPGYTQDRLYRVTGTVTDGTYSLTGWTAFNTTG